MLIFNMRFFIRRAKCHSGLKVRLSIGCFFLWALQGVLFAEGDGEGTDESTNNKLASNSEASSSSGASSSSSIDVPEDLYAFRESGSSSLSDNASVHQCACAICDGRLIIPVAWGGSQDVFSYDEQMDAFVSEITRRGESGPGIRYAWNKEGLIGLWMRESLWPEEEREFYEQRLRSVFNSLVPERYWGSGGVLEAASFLAVWDEIAFRQMSFRGLFWGRWDASALGLEGLYGAIVQIQNFVQMSLNLSDLEEEPSTQEWVRQTLRGWVDQVELWREMLPATILPKSNQTLTKDNKSTDELEAFKRAFDEQWERFLQGARICEERMVSRPGAFWPLIIIRELLGEVEVLFRRPTLSEENKQKRISEALRLWAPGSCGAQAIGNTFNLRSERF